jgi:hypothetical protein
MDITIHELAGQEVSGICFVRDYVEVHFDGPVLRCLSGPILRMNGREWVFPEDGSRDALCTLIGRTVESLSLDDDVRLSMRFDTDTELIVPLDRASRIGPEAMHFVPMIGGPIQVW